MPRTTPRTPPRPTADVPDVERVPWSLLGPEFIREWGRPRGEAMPEHLEILGPTGSGKSFLLGQILLERVRRRATAVVYIATKKADGTIGKLGWPVVQTWRDVQRHDQVVYWPRTKAIGTKRKEYQAERIQDLLDRLWHEDSNTVVVFDEASYVETLSADLKATMQMYLREGRSHGLTCVLGKQRVQGIQRDMHSESDWKIAFKMNDRADNERLAELFGKKTEWLPIVESLDRERYEFLIQHKLTGATFISWVDKPVSPAKVAEQRTGYLK